jgi:hypothetical protein
MFGRLFKKAQNAVAPDPFVTQALEDQKKSDYPGCPEGLMECRAFCDCYSTGIPSAAWVNRRAEFLRRVATCEHKRTRPFRPSMFPEFVSGEQCLDCKGVLKTGADKWEMEN